MEAAGLLKGGAGPADFATGLPEHVDDQVDRILAAELVLDEGREALSESFRSRVEARRCREIVEFHTSVPLIMERACRAGWSRLVPCLGGVRDWAGLLVALAVDGEAWFSMEAARLSVGHGGGFGWHPDAPAKGAVR